MEKGFKIQSSVVHILIRSLSTVTYTDKMCRSSTLIQNYPPISGGKIAGEKLSSTMSMF